MRGMCGAWPARPRMPDPSGACHPSGACFRVVVSLLTRPLYRRLIHRSAQGGSRLSSALLLVPCAVAGGLGVWQLQRREWKQAQLQEREEQLSAPPLSLRALDITQRVGAWRRVTGQGQLRHEAAAFVRLPYHCAQRLPCARSDALTPRAQVGPRVRTIGGTARKGYLLVRQRHPGSMYRQLHVQHQ